MESFKDDLKKTNLKHSDNTKSFYEQALLFAQKSYSLDQLQRYWQKLAQNPLEDPDHLLPDYLSLEEKKDFIGRVHHLMNQVEQAEKHNNFSSVQANKESSTPQWALFSTSGRTELAGNHTDHNHGLVLAAPIQKDILAMVRPISKPQIVMSDVVHQKKYCVDFRQGIPAQQSTESLMYGIFVEFIDWIYRQKGHSRSRLYHWSKQEKAKAFDELAEIFHNMSQDYPWQGWEIFLDSQVPVGGGLSSSAAIEVLLATIMNYYFGQPLSLLALAQLAQKVENVYFGKPCGLMDQCATAMGGVCAIDFLDTDHPQLQFVHTNFIDYGYQLCLLDTKVSHSDLTQEYAFIVQEMQQVAQLLGVSYLGQTNLDTLLSHWSFLQSQVPDRAILRAMHFFQDCQRVQQMHQALTNGDIHLYLDCVAQSGQSSLSYLQNLYCCGDYAHQAMVQAIALVDYFFKKHQIKGATRVHGGGFAGCIQIYIPCSFYPLLQEFVRGIFKEDRLIDLTIRPYNSCPLGHWEKSE